MDYYVRGTFTRNNLDFSKDVLHYADLGFKQMSMEPVVAEPEMDYAIRRRIFPRSWKSMTSWQWNTLSVKKKEEASISSTL